MSCSASVTRDVYEELDGRQFVYDDDKLPVYGVWLLVDEPTSLPADGEHSKYK